MVTRESVIDCVMKNGLQKSSILDSGSSSAMIIRSLPKDSEAMKLNDFPVQLEMADVER